MAEPRSPAIEVERLSFRYHGSRDHALIDVGFTIADREWVGLLGPNGGGKTTLLMLLLGLLRPDQGRILVFGERPSRARLRVGYVPQDAGVDSTVPASVLDVVLLGRLTRTSWGPRYSRDDRERAMAALDETQTSDLADRAWRTLSGGQRQRVLIARALAAQADLLLLDEPTTGIDTHREKALLQLLEELNQRLPIVMVSHDTALVSHHMDRAIWIDRGAREIDVHDLGPERLEHLYHGEGH
jgi:zinc transport system ATP-binding protein